MAVPRHLETAATALEAAEHKLLEARALPVTLDSLATWLGALTDYALALSDLQRFSNESLHEKVGRIARLVRAPIAPGEARSR